MSSCLARFALFVLAAALTACGDDNVSGTYVAKSFGSVAMLELVQTDDGKISGKLTTVSAAKGRVRDGNASVSGVVNDAAISLTIQPTIGPLSLSIVTTTMAGTANSDTLRLNTDASNGRVQTIEFLRSDISEFESWASSIRETVRNAAETQAKADAKAKQEKEAAEALAKVERAQAQERARIQRERDELLSDIQAFTDRVAKFEKTTGEFIPKFRNAETRYREVTVRAQQMRDQQRTVPNHSRGQIAFALRSMLSFTGPMEGTRKAAEATTGDFEKGASDGAAIVKRLTSGCGGINAGSDNDSELVAACGSLPSVASKFSAAVDKLRAAISATDQVYREETKKQQAILAEAESVR